MDINRIEENRDVEKVNSVESELRSLLPDGETTLENISTQESLLLGQKFKNEWKNIGKYIKYYLFICLFSLLIFPLSAALPTDMPMEVQPADKFFVIFFSLLFFVALLIYPLLSLWKSSKCFGLAVNDEEEQQLLSAIRYQKKFWKYLVIFTVCFLVIYLLLVCYFILLALLGAALGV